MSVSQTGAFTLSTNSLSSLLAPERTTPPPTNIYGFLDAFMSSIALSMSLSVIISVSRSGSLISCLVYSTRSAVTFFGISTSTGPGLPFLAILKALRIVSASFSTSFTIKLYLVTGVVIPAISIS